MEKTSFVMASAMIGRAYLDPDDRLAGGTSLYGFAPS